MIVDDDAAYLRAVRRVLWTLAHDLDVSTYSSGEEALRALEREPADMVVVDVMMPELDGIETCRRLKARGPCYVVLVSGHMSDATKTRAYEAGADLALPKPYDLADLLAARFQLTGGSATLIELLSSEHVAMAQNIARAMSRKYGALLSSADIEGLALLGLCEAARRYDPARNGLFIAFAASRVRGAVLDEVRRTASSRRMSAWSDDVQAASGEVDSFGGAQPAIDHELAEAQLCAAVRSARAQLAGLEAEIIDLHYERGESFTEIARTLRLPRTRVLQLHTRGLELLRTYPELGVTSEQRGRLQARARRRTLRPTRRTDAPANRCAGMRGDVTKQSA